MVQEAKGKKSSMAVCILEEEMYEESLKAQGFTYITESSESLFSTQWGLDSVICPKPQAANSSTNNVLGNRNSRNTEYDKKSEYSDPNLKDGKILFTNLLDELNVVMPPNMDFTELEFIDRLTFMSRRLASLWSGKELTQSNFTRLKELLNHSLFLVAFPIVFESFRKWDLVEIHEFSFERILELVQHCIVEVELVLM